MFWISWGKMEPGIHLKENDTELGENLDLERCGQRWWWVARWQGIGSQLTTWGREEATLIQRRIVLIIKPCWNLAILRRHVEMRTLFAGRESHRREIKVERIYWDCDKEKFSLFNIFRNFILNNFFLGFSPFFNFLWCLRWEQFLVFGEVVISWGTN